MILANAWQKFEAGDAISDEELAGMLAQARASLLYMYDRGPQYYLAASDTRKSLTSLESINDLRKIRKVFT